MLAVLFSLLLAASDTNDATATLPQEAAANEAVDPEKKICKRQPVTGQLQGTKRVCMTAEQWKRTQEAQQRPRR